MRLRSAQHDNLIITNVHIVTWVVISVTLIALVYNVQFAPLQGDDYAFSRLLREVGADSFTAHRYQTWNGRFASDIWYTIFYSIIDVVAHPWAGALIIIVLFTAGAWYGYVRFLGTCAQTESNAVHRNRDIIALTGVLLFFYLLVIHTSTLYGISTAAPYQIGPVHLLGQMAGLCALMRSMHRPESQGRITWRRCAAIAGLAVSALVISGYRESFVLLSLLFYGIGALWSALHCRRTLWVWVVVCVMAVIGGIIVLFAPGNAVRLAVLFAPGNAVRLADVEASKTIASVAASEPASTFRVFLASLWRYIWVSVYGVFRILGVFFLLPLCSLTHSYDPYPSVAIHGYLHRLGAVVRTGFSVRRSCSVIRLSLLPLICQTYMYLVTWDRRSCV